MVNKKIVILPCAGVGSRFSQVIPKQYTLINNKTIIEHTLSVFLSIRQIDQIIIVTAVDDQYIDRLVNLGKISMNDKIRILKIGGQTRAQTIRNVVNSLKCNQDDWLLVHDVVRCCIKSDVVLRLITQLENDDVGGILAIGAADTIKVSQNGLIINKTLDRCHIYHAQTPQMFRAGVLKDALNLAPLDLVTDEASAVEQINLPVKLVEGERNNVKITYPTDIKLAEAILNSD